MAEFIWNQRCYRVFGLEASGPGKQESKFGGERKPLKKGRRLPEKQESKIFAERFPPKKGRRFPEKARKQDFRRALRAQKKVVTSQKSKKARFWLGSLAR